MMTMAELLERMGAAGAIDAEAPQRVAVALAAHPEDRTPWYLHLLVGLGSWIAGLLLLVAFGIAGWLDSGEGAVIFGLVLCGAAVAVRLAVARLGVLTQVPLTMALAGELMVFGGIWIMDGGILGPGGDRSLSLALAGLAALELVMIAAYRDELHRFIATLAACASLCGLLILNELHIPLALLAVGLAWATALAWEREALLARWDDLARPLAYGLALGLLGVVWALLLAEGTFDWLASVGLASALAYQAWRLTDSAPARLRAAAVGGVALLLAFAWGSPGLLAAPLVMVAGFSRGNRSLTALGALFLGGYLIFYYYNMELTLLLKSLVLLASGAALLAARAGLGRLTQ